MRGVRQGALLGSHRPCREGQGPPALKVSVLLDTCIMRSYSVHETGLGPAQGSQSCRGTSWDLICAEVATFVLSLALSAYDMGRFWRLWHRG